MFWKDFEERKVNPVKKCSFYKNFSFGNSYRFIRSCKSKIERSCVPFAPFSPMLTSNLSIAQYQNQETNISTTHWTYWDFTSFTDIIHVCVNVHIPCNFITYVDSCTHCHSQGTELFHYTKILILLFTVIHTSPPIVF